MKSMVFKQLSSGVLYAGAAIGVSHLVQSTRAGASFGLELIIAVILIHILKYSFFKAGAWYPAVTGKSLIHGYQSISPIAIWTFLLLSLLCMSIIIAAIAMVCAGLMANLFGSNISVSIWSLLLLLSSVLLISNSNTDTLSKYLKWVVLALSLTTIVCLLAQTPQLIKQLQSFKGFTFRLNHRADFIFLIAFLGWMPAPMDISVWQSMWIVESKQTLSYGERIRDFNIGYWGTAIMAVVFILLGSLIFYQSGIILEQGAVGFTAQFLDMYVQTLGAWVYPFIAFAALATMLSTLITCLDAFPKAIKSSITTIAPNTQGIFTKDKTWLVFNAASSFLIIVFFASSLSEMVDFATTLSFVAGPILAYLNYRLMFKDRPWGLWKSISCLGLIVLTILAISYLLL